MSKKHSILLVTAFFPPEVNSSAQIYSDLAHNFSKRGHNVDVLTSYPRDHARIDESSTTVPLDESIQNVSIHRVKHPAQRDNKILRGLEHFYIPLYYAKRFRKLVEEGKKYDVVIIYIAPLPLCYLGRWIHREYKIPVILNIEEFHPQELTDVSFLTNPLIISVMKFIERSACKHANYITVHSPGGVPYLQERGADLNKMSVTFNSIDASIVTNPSIPADYKERHNYQNKFLISYGGLLSPFQGLDKILDVAKYLQDDADDIDFVIAGDGMIKDKLLEKIEEEEICNVKIVPFMPREDYINFIKSSEISIVALDSRMMSPVLPGKLAYLMGLGVAIVAIVNPTCETANIIREANCGIVVDPNDIKAFADAILKLKSDDMLRKKMGENGQKYMLEHMSSDVVVQTYESVFEKIEA